MFYSKSPPESSGKIDDILPLCRNILDLSIFSAHSYFISQLSLDLSRSFNIFTFQILSIDKSLKDPKVLTSAFGILNVGILSPTLLAIMFGTLGYYAFGTMEENILRSLPYDEP